MRVGDDIGGEAEGGSSTRPRPPVELGDPDLDPRELARLARERPDLDPAILQHPQCDPELAAWVTRHETVPGPGRPSADQWAAQFLRGQGREPTMTEYLADVAGGEIAPARRFSDASVQQMTSGAKQVAAGAKEFLNARVAPAVEKAGAKEFVGNRVAPAARSAAVSVRRAAGERSLPSGQQESLR